MGILLDNHNGLDRFYSSATNNGLDRFYSSATSVNQPGQSVNYSPHTNTQLVSSPSINPSNDDFPSNTNNNNRFDIIYDTINLTQPGQSVPYDQYSFHTNTSVVQNNASQFVSPLINPSNNGSPSNISNNNNGIYNAINVTQPRQSVPCGNCSLHATTSVAQYNIVSSSPINPSKNGSPSDISDNNNNNGFGRPVPYDNYNLHTTTPVVQYNAITDSSPSQTQTNDSGTFRFMIPGFQIIVIPM